MEAKIFVAQTKIKKEAKLYIIEAIIVDAKVKILVAEAKMVVLGANVVDADNELIFLRKLGSLYYRVVDLYPFSLEKLLV